MKFEKKKNKKHPVSRNHYWEFRKSFRVKYHQAEIPHLFKMGAVRKNWSIFTGRTGGFPKKKKKKAHIN